MLPCDGCILFFNIRYTQATEVISRDACKLSVVSRHNERDVSTVCLYLYLSGEFATSHDENIQ